MSADDFSERVELPGPRNRYGDRLPARQPHDLILAKNAVECWTHEADELAEQGDWESLGDGLDRIRALRKQLSDLERHVEDHVAALMPDKRIVVSGLGMERRTSKDRRAWQSEAIVRELWVQTSVDFNGETVEPFLHAERFREAIEECVPLTGSLGWRVKALAEYGIDPEDYAEVTPGRTSVQTWRPDDG